MPAIDIPGRPAEVGLPYVFRRPCQRMAAGKQLVGLAVRACPGLSFGTVVLHVVAGVLPITFMVCVSLALQQLSHGLASGAALGLLPGWLGIAAGAFVAQQLLAPVQTLASQGIARKVDAYCTARLMRSASIGVSMRSLERPEVADAARDTSEALNSTALTPGAAAEGALALVARYTQLFGAVAVATIAVGPLVGTAALAVALICRHGQTAAFRRWGQHVRSLSRARRRLGYLRDLAVSTRAAKEIRMLGLVDWIDRRYAAESANLLGQLWARRRRLYGRPFMLYTLLGLTGTLVALLALTAQARLDIARVAIGLQAVVLCARFGVIFMESDDKLIYGRSAWESLLIFEELGAGLDTGSAAPAEYANGGAVAPSMSDGTGPFPVGDIAFHGVSFEYEAGRPVLAGLDLDIAARTSTAIVGANGAGKTTLIKLLTGLYQPTSGMVSCGGVDLADIDPERWRRSFAVLFQDFVRYELTLRDNVTMGAADHRDDDEGIFAELDRVGLADLVRSMPAGLDAPLSGSTTGGRDLSGGQWQRVALARALFAVRHGASVLVLDEPTAQLDAHGEAEFYDTFHDLTRGLTSVVISHRFSSVRRADRIVLIQGGRLLEFGTHDELVAAKGAYASMFELQARRFAVSSGAA
jgi:ATP-binding cassette subfamily B protein